MIPICSEIAGRLGIIDKFRMKRSRKEITFIGNFKTELNKLLHLLKNFIENVYKQKKRSKTDSVIKNFENNVSVGKSNRSFRENEAERNYYSEKIKFRK